MSNWSYPEILADAEPFRSLEPDALESVWRAGRVREAARGQELFQQGDPASHLYVLLSGAIKMFQVTENGSEVIQGFIAPGEMFACVAAAGAASYPATAVAEADSRAAAWTCDTFATLMARYPALGRDTMGSFGQRLQMARERMVDMATKTSDQRIAAVLLRLARRRADKPAEGAELQAPISVSRQEIAAMSGTGLYTVSRTLQAWARAGLLEVGRRQVAVLDPAALGAIYSGETPAPTSRAS